jgi:hypothetical protein
MLPESVQINIPSLAVALEFVFFVVDWATMHLLALENMTLTT